MSNQAKGVTFLICGPTASGKSTHRKTLQWFCRLTHRNSFFSVSWTTRQKRSGEVNKKDYHFRSRKQFDAEVQRAFFLEYEAVYGTDWYGTPRGPLLTAIDSGAICVADVDVNGCRRLKGALETFERPKPVTVFIYVPEPDEIWRRSIGRLGKKSKDDLTTAEFETITRRVARAEKENEYRRDFDHVIVSRNEPDSRYRDAARFMQIVFKYTLGK